LTPAPYLVYFAVLKLWKFFFPLLLPLEPFPKELRPMMVVESPLPGANPVLWLVCGGPSSERHVSLASAKSALNNIDYSKFCVRVACIAPDGRWMLSARLFEEKPDPAEAGDLFSRFTEPDDYPVTLSAARAMARLESDKPLCAFNAMHGRVGEDGVIQGLFAMMGVPMTGSGVAASALAMDKVRCRLALEAAGLAVSRGVTFTDQPGRPRPDAATLERRISFPCFVKPVFGGSSLGVTKVRRPEDLDAALDVALAESPQVLIEEGIDGTEVTCGVLEDEHGQPRALVPTEICPRAGRDFFDFQAKYVAGETDEITPARLDDDMLSRVRAAAVAAHRALGCAGYSRSDFIIGRDKVIYALEVNTLPGFTPTSLLPQGAAAMGIDFPALVMRIIVAGLSPRQAPPFGATFASRRAEQHQPAMAMQATA
jgi:D-alanine-D-alanine ligase